MPKVLKACLNKKYLKRPSESLKFILKQTGSQQIENSTGVMCSRLGVS